MMKRFFLTCLALAVPAIADELDRSTVGQITWTVKDWPADGRLMKPKGIGNLTAAYFANDATRKPLTVEFNHDATVVTVHVPKQTPAQRALVLELAEETTRHPNGRIVFSALDAKVHGTKAKLETHAGNHRIGFWVDAADFVQWKSDLPSVGSYDVELTYSAAGPSGTRAVIELAGKPLPVTLKTTGSWYRYVTLPVGRIKITKVGPHVITVKCTKKVGGAVMNLKAIVLRPIAPAREKFKDYFVGTVKVRVHEAELSEDRKRVPWTGYGVDGGFPGTVVTAVEITNASGTYSLPADMVNDLGNPNGNGHVRLIGSPTAIRTEVLELSMTNGDGAGGHNVLFQVDFKKAQARRFVKVAIDDNHTKTHDWTTIKNHKETKRKAPAKEKGAKKVDDRVRDPRMEKCMAILLKNQPHPDRYPPKVKDISKVEGLTAWDINNEELALIAPYLSHLKWLHFYRMSVGGPSVSDVSPLKVMKNLEKLIFDGTCEKVTDFSVLRNLKNLKHLNLEGTQFSDVSSLESLTKLEILNLCDTPVKDLSALKNLKKLTKLNLDGTQVSDVSVLENLKNLKTLDLEGTQVKDLSALKNLKDLTELRLVETPVRNLSPLHGLKLKSLDVELNKFSVKELEMDAKFLSKIKDLYAGSGDYDVKLLRFFVKHRIGNEFRVAYKKIPVEVILDKQVRTIESRKELEGLGLDETVLSGVDLKSNLILTEQKDLNDPNGTRLLGINYSVTNRSFSVGVMTTCIGFRDAGRWTTKFYSVKRVD